MARTVGLVIPAKEEVKAEPKTGKVITTKTRKKKVEKTKEDKEFEEREAE